MHLEVGGELLPVNQLGPDFAIVEATAAHSPAKVATTRTARPPNTICSPDVARMFSSE